METNPLAPESPDEKAPEGNASEGEDKPPADDAPINRLVYYWSNYTGGDTKQAPEPSDRVRQRLLEAIEERPELAYSLAQYLPENTDTHDRLYKLLFERRRHMGRRGRGQNLVYISRASVENSLAPVSKIEMNL